MEYDELVVRVRWLERQVGQLLWLIVQLSSLGMAWIIASTVTELIGEARYGWQWFAVAVPAFFFVGWFHKRVAFRGAPEDMEDHI